ncbi:helix-turn-helix domain-containing protein [Pedobacter sp. WC2501]
MRQNAFADLCNISQTYLSQIENNIKEPNISTLK